MPLRAHQQPGDQHGDLGNEGDQHQHQDHHQVEGQAGLRGVLDPQLADGAAGE